VAVEEDGEAMDSGGRNLRAESGEPTCEAAAASVVVGRDGCWPIPGFIGPLRGLFWPRQWTGEEAVGG